MADGIENTRAILFNDLDAEFLMALSKELPWVYAELYDELAGQPHLTDECRGEEFNKRRGDAVRNAIGKICVRHGIPFEIVRLAANGQHRIVVSAGRVIIIQEPVDAFNDDPKPADYKVGLADAHGLVRQLELELGDRLNVPRPWSGCILAVLLHGPHSKGWSRGARQLGTLSLGVPDASYTHWILRPDLHAIAMYGDTPDPREERGAEVLLVQEDNVVVTAKKKNAAKRTA